MNTTENQTTFRLQNLSTGYRLRQRDIVLASGLEATLRTGELTCLLGPNGAGKSTLLRTMARFQEPLAGNISLQGQPLDSYKPNELARRVGVVLTDKLPSSNLRAEELVGMGRMPYTGFWGNLSDDDQRAVDEALQMVGMTSFRHRRLSTLSDGEQQKLMIAKALAQQTPVILLDEPVAFLDFPSKEEESRATLHSRSGTGSANGRPALAARHTGKTHPRHTRGTRPQRQPQHILYLAWSELRP